MKRRRLNKKRPADSLYFEAETVEPQTDAGELQNEGPPTDTATADCDPKADFVTAKTLRRVIEELLRGRSLEKLTFGAFFRSWQMP